MKSTGIIRKIDELGRIVIPMEMRRRMGIMDADPVEIFVDGDRIILSKFHTCCVFCGASEDVVEFKNKKICPDCLRTLKGN